MTRFWNLRNDQDAPEDGVLDIDGEIVAEAGWFTSDGTVVAKDFRKALEGLRNVTVHINSPGGDVMAGAEIYSALREHSLTGRGEVTVIVTALAASAASIVAMAGDRILMHPVAYMMIHNPWTIAMGDAKELRKTAKVLDEISEGLISAYQTRTGKDRDELKKMLENTTWMSAVTCVEEGFADEIIGSGTQAAACACKMSQKAHDVGEIVARTFRPEETGNAAQDAAEKAREQIARYVSGETAVNGTQPEENDGHGMFRAAGEEIRERMEIIRRAEIAEAAMREAMAR